METKQIQSRYNWYHFSAMKKWCHASIQATTAQYVILSHGDANEDGLFAYKLYRIEYQSSVASIC